VASRTEGAETLRITRPTRQIVLMLIILACVIAGGVLVWPMVQPVFLSSPYLNGTIGIVFVVGVLACFWQVFQLFSSVAWIEAVGSGGGGGRRWTGRPAFWRRRRRSAGCAAGGCR
jgi:hypothetical protein